MAKLRLKRLEIVEINDLNAKDKFVLSDLF